MAIIDPFDDQPIDGIIDPFDEQPIGAPKAVKPPPRDVSLGGVLSSFLKGAGGYTNQGARALNLALGGIPTIVDKAASLVTGQPTTKLSDLWFEKMVDPLAAQQQEFALPADANMVDKVSNAAGTAGAMLGQSFMTGGANVAPVAPAVTAAVPTVRQVAQNAIVNEGARGVSTMTLPGAQMGIDTANDVYQQTGNAQQAARAGVATLLNMQYQGLAPAGAVGSVGKRVATGAVVNPLLAEVGNQQVVNPNLPTNMRRASYIDNPEEAVPDIVLGALMHGAMGARDSGPTIRMETPAQADRLLMNPKGVAQEIVDANTVAPEQPMSLAEIIAAATGAPKVPESTADWQTQQKAEAQKRQETGAEYNKLFTMKGEDGKRRPIDVPDDGSGIPASREQAINQTYEAAGENPASVRSAFERGRAAAEGDLRTPRSLRGEVPPEYQQRIADVSGIPVEDIARMSGEGQRRLLQAHWDAISKLDQGGETLYTSFEGSPDGNLTSPAEKPNVPGDRMGERYGVTEEGAQEVKAARTEGDYTQDINQQNNALRERLIASLDGRRSSLRDIDQQIAGIQREVDTGRQLSEKERGIFDAMKQRRQQMADELRKTEDKIYDLERTTSAGSKQASGGSARPFKGDFPRYSDSGEPMFKADRAAEFGNEQRAEGMKQKTHDDLMREWQMREDARKERERHKQQNEEDRAYQREREYYSQQQRKSRSEKGDKKQGFSDAHQPYDEKAGAFKTDDFGFVLSTKGGPIKFSSDNPRNPKDNSGQKKAARWILGTGNKAKGIRQTFEIANHPSGDGFTVRVTKTSEPPPGGGKDAGPKKDAGSGLLPNPEAKQAEQPQQPPPKSAPRSEAKAEDVQPAKEVAEVAQEPAPVDAKPDDADPFAQQQTPVETRLREMIGEAGWAERGGKVIREYSPDGPEAGAVVGRTKWIPRHEWWAGKPAHLTESNIKSIVERGLAGEQMGKRDAAAFEWLKEQAETELAALREAKLEETKQNADDQASVAEYVGHFGEDALEAAAIRHGDDDAAFIEDIRRANDEARAKQDAEAGEGREGAVQDGKGARPENEVAGEGNGRGDERPDFNLEQPTAEELRARQQRIDDAEKAEQKRQADAAAKEKADAERDAFQMRGSDRAADDPNQNDMFGNSQRAEPDSKKAQERADALFSLKDMIRSVRARNGRITRDMVEDWLRYAERAGVTDHYSSMALRNMLFDGTAVKEVMARLEDRIVSHNQSKADDGLAPGSLSANPFFNPAMYRKIYDSIVKAYGAVDNGRTASAVKELFGGGFDNGLIPNKTMFDNLRKKIQDSFVYLDKVQKRLEEQSGSKLADDINTYQRMSLMHGRRGEAISLFEKDHVAKVHDVLKQIHKNLGVTLDDVDQFLMARHAEERNNMVAKRNSQLPDAGSGITTAEARKTLDGFRKNGKLAGLERLGKVTDDIAKFQRDMMLQYGLISKETHARLAQYKHYVPLKGEEFDAMFGTTRGSQGVGLDLPSRPVRAATGRWDAAKDALTNLLVDTEGLIVIGEKNRVNQSLLNLVKKHPSSLWRVDSKTTKAFVGKDGTVTYRDTKGTGNNVIKVRVNGEQFEIHFAPEAAHVYEPLRNANSENVIPFLANATRVMSSLATQLNPEFVLTNLARDIQTAMINAAGDGNIKISSKFVNPKNVLGAMKGIYKDLRTSGEAKGEWSKWHRQFAEDGGTTYFLDRKSVQQTSKELAHVMKVADGNLLAVGVDGFRALARFVGDANGAAENASRLIYYRALVEGGTSRERAAAMAKDLTVNFNRKGEMSPLLTSAYMFFNASVQGSARVIQASATSKTVQKILGGMAVAGFALSQYNRQYLSDEDEDGRLFYDKVPDEIKSRYFVVMIPKGMEDAYDKAMPDSVRGKVRGIRGGQDYIKLFPLPYGYNVPVVAGMAAGDAMAGRNPLDAAASVTKAISNSFDPFGDGNLLVRIMPSVVKPLVEVKINEAWTGRKIHPEQIARQSQHQPNSSVSNRYTMSGFKWLAESANKWTGGDKYEPGYVDVHPDSLEYLARQYASGPGNILLSAVDAVTEFSAEREVDPARLPFIRKALGRNDARPYDAYLDAVKEIQNDIARNTDGEEVKNYGSLLMRSPLRREEAADRDDMAARRKIRNSTVMDDGEKREALEALNAVSDERKKRFLRKYYEAGGEPKGWKSALE